MTSFTIVDANSPSVSALSQSFQIRVESKKSPVDFLCNHDESLLNAGLRHGLTLPYECATGTCGSCRARVMSGKANVVWPEAPGAKRLKPEKGDILMCQTRPNSALHLRIPANVDRDERSLHLLPAHYSGTIARTKRLTDDVLHFEIELSSPISFEAGQFIVLKVPGLEGGRAYSMVNYASQTNQLELVVKRKPDGGFGNYMFEEHTSGQMIELFGPLGHATFHPEEMHDLLLIAGGSGIAGLMSILARATKESYFKQRKAHVFFGVRTLADCFYLDRLSAYAESAQGNLTITLALSDQLVAAGTHPDHSSIHLAHGFIHTVIMEGQSVGLANSLAYIAGPPPMVDGVIGNLIRAGLPVDRIRYDKFG